MFGASPNTLKAVLALLLFQAKTSHSRFVGVRKSCFNFGEEIHVDFDNRGTPPPDFADWIGLTSPFALVNVFDVPQPIMWTWTCGDQACAVAVFDGTVVFGPGGPEEAGIDSWPLQPGEYVFYLTGGSFPFQARALSMQFTVFPEGEYCPGTAPETRSPTKSPTSIPTMTPTKLPTPQPTNLPTSTPTTFPTTTPSNSPSQPQPTSPPTLFPTPPIVVPEKVVVQDQFQDVGGGQQPVSPGNVVTRSDLLEAVRDAREDIEFLINRDGRLGPKFLRLAFHDCVGGCDGCVDMRNPDNGGLEFPIGALEGVVARYESRGLSRTDIWMLSSIVASNLLQPTDEAIEWPFQWVGRKTCDELHDNDCHDEDGNSVSCSTERGPHRHLPHGDSGTTTLENFFREEFGWNGKQAVAIMGAHSVGRLRRRNLGFDGDEGWDLTNDVLDNGYYIELVGKGTARDQDELPNFTQALVRNADLNSIPSRLQFEASVEGKKVVMLTSDIAMARQLEEGVNLLEDGAVTCNFKGFRNRCPDARPFIEHMKLYGRNFGVFLEDFRDVMNLMIDHGYLRTGTCPQGEVCELKVAAGHSH